MMALSLASGVIASLFAVAIITVLWYAGLSLRQLQRFRRIVLKEPLEGKDGECTLALEETLNFSESDLLLSAIETKPDKQPDEPLVALLD